MGLFSYDNKPEQREDLLSIIKDVSATKDNYLVTNLGTSTARNTLHEWGVFNLARPTSNTFTAEGADYADQNLTTPTRSTNFTAILTEAVRVSGTERALDTITHQDPMQFQKAKRLPYFKARMEFAVLNGGAVVSGASGTARQMAGINSVISTNLTARSSGTSFSATELEDILQNSWDAVGQGDVADTLLCTMGIKRKIAGFTTRVTQYNNSTKDINADVMTYEASSGMVKIIPHKDVINATGSTHVYALKLDNFKMAFLSGREPKFEDLPKTGDSSRGWFITEMTLESLAERASVKRYGYNQNG